MKDLYYLLYRPPHDCAYESKRRMEQSKWASRRGLPELDLLLAPFVNDAFNTLDDGLDQITVSCYFKMIRI